MNHVVNIIFFSFSGCGLGMVSILLDKLNICKSIIATDGDDDTMVLLAENILYTGTIISSSLQYTF